MDDGHELELNADLFEAVHKISGITPTIPEPVVVLSAYIYALSQGYGLSDSTQLTDNQFDRVELPASAAELVDHVFAANAGAASELDGTSIGDNLYGVFVDLAEDPSARKAINRSEPLSEVGMLKVAQVFWNLEATSDRPRLPLTAGPLRIGKRADIKVPRADRDFALMTWAARVSEGVDGLGSGRAARSSGQGLRTKGARLAVLAARRLLDRASPLPTVDGATLEVNVPDRGKPTARIVWSESVPPTGASHVTANEHETGDGPQPAAVAAGRRPPVVVGRGAEVGDGYQRRGFDAEIDRLWADGGDRRVWLRGGPGMGKSYSARRIRQQAIADRSANGPDLVIWVDSADVESVTSALSSAVDEMPHLGISVKEDDPQRPQKQARNLLTALETSDWRWLVVLDNAEAALLIESELIPSGQNSNGRVLLTTPSRDHRITRHGRIIQAKLFEPIEAEEYLRGQIDPKNGNRASLAGAPAADLAELAEAVGHHPLALSIASATIVANGMDIADWTADFRASLIDDAADAIDGGGYPTGIAATWRVALEKASIGLPRDFVVRAAAVAAVLDPDGHPTWLWERHAVTTWVAGSAELQRRPGRPPTVLQRLVDHSILSLNGNWKSGTVTIHQLTARVIRELFGTDELAELGAILADEWLRRIAEEDLNVPHGLRGNLQALTASVKLATPALEATTALLGFAGLHNGTVDSEAPSNTAPWARNTAFWESVLADSLAGYRIFASVREHSGIDGLAGLAFASEQIGNALRQLGQPEEARGQYIETSQLSSELIDHPDASVAQRARALVSRANVLDELDRRAEAGDDRTRAAELFEQLIDTEPDAVKAFEFLEQLTALHESIGGPNLRLATLARHDATLKRTEELPSPSLDTTQADAMADTETLAGIIARTDLVTWAMRLDRVAKLRRDIGQADDYEIVILTRIVETQRLAGAPTRHAHLDLARVFIRTEQWDSAEEALQQITTLEDRDDSESHADDLVRLASIQAHNGHSDEITRILIQAADVYRRLAPRSEIQLWDLLPGEFALVKLLEMAFDEFADKSWDRAHVFFESHTEHLREAMASNPLDHEGRLAHSFYCDGISLVKMGQPARAIEPFTRAVSIQQTLAELDLADMDAQRSFLGTLTVLGDAHTRAGDLEQASAALRRAVDAHEALTDSSDLSLSFGMVVALRLQGLADAFALRGRLEDAAAHWSLAVAVHQVRIDRADGASTQQRDLARLLIQIGHRCDHYDLFDEAIEYLDRAIQVTEAITVSEPEDIDAPDSLALAYIQLAAVHQRRGNLGPALANAEHARDRMRRASASNPADRDTQRLLAAALMHVAEVLSACDRDDEAREHFLGAARTLQMLVDLAPDTRDAELYVLLRALGDALPDVGLGDIGTDLTSRADDLASRFPDLDNSGEP